MSVMTLFDHCCLWNVQCVMFKNLFCIVITVLHKPLSLLFSFPQTLTSFPAPSVSIWPTSLGDLCLPCLKQLIGYVWLPELDLRSGPPHQSPRPKVTELLQWFWHSFRGRQPMMEELQQDDVSGGPACCPAPSQVCFLSWTLCSPPRPRFLFCESLVY